MTTTTTIDLTCPNCEHVFTSHASGERPRGRKRTDFQVQASGVATLRYGVHQCERCGLAGRQELFESGKPVSYDVRRRVWDELAPKMAENAPSASEKYEFAAKVAVWDGASSSDIADLWLRAAWCCVDEGDIEAERYFRRLAAWQFEESLDGYDALQREDRGVITYLIGELWRRIGDDEQAAEWFDRVADEVVDNREHGWVVRWAKQQRDDPREWFI